MLIVSGYPDPHYDPDAPEPVLTAFFNKIVQGLCPTPWMLANPEHRVSRIQAKKQGRCDEIFAEMDPARMTPLARQVFLRFLIKSDRLDEAVRRFPNLRPLLEEPMPTHDSAPRCQIERNLAASLLMQLDDHVDPGAVAAKLPPYELAESFEERAVMSASRVMAAAGLTTDDQHGKVCMSELTAWFADNDAEVDQA